MASSKMTIKGTIDIESVVKLHCYNLKCKNNLATITEEAQCNLKHVWIDEQGCCQMFELKEEK